MLPNMKQSAPLGKQTMNKIKNKVPLSIEAGRVLEQWSQGGNDGRSDFGLECVCVSGGEGERGAERERENFICTFGSACGFFCLFVFV